MKEFGRSDRSIWGCDDDATEDCEHDKDICDYFGHLMIMVNVPKQEKVLMNRN